MYMIRCMLFFFFFQAEDGIRDIGVTGVQTCALPISTLSAGFSWMRGETASIESGISGAPGRPPTVRTLRAALAIAYDVQRSEERRVGKECRSRWSPYH